MAVKNDRARIYKLSEVGSNGAIDQQYVRQVGDGLLDEAYWVGLAYISGRETTVGAQGQHTVLYDVVMDDTVPLENTDDAVIAVLGANDEEIQFVKVMSVGKLRTTGEKIARTNDVSDENWAERLTA